MTTTTTTHEVISRAEAKAKGLKFFFTGKPCKRGGVSLRKVGNGDCVCPSCVEALRGIKRASARRINPPKGRFIHPTEESRRAALNESNKKWQKKNRDKCRIYDMKWRLANPEEHKAGAAIRNKGWGDKNKEYKAANGKKWRKEKPHMVNAHTANRRARRLNATPHWFEELDAFVIQEAADLAKRRAAVTGIRWSIDHMIPLQARNACGLHIAGNIQVIPSSMNSAKREKMVLTEPGDWISHL